jgi:HK97 gp10 family phage protein
VFFDPSADDKRGAWRPSRQGNYIISVGDTSVMHPKFSLGGNLKRSLRMTSKTDAKGTYGEVVAGGVDAPYAKYVEFGTRHAMAQPFLRPAFMKVQEQFIKDVALGLRDLEMKYPVR